MTERRDCPELKLPGVKGLHIDQSPKREGRPYGDCLLLLINPQASDVDIPLHCITVMAFSGVCRVERHQPAHMQRLQAAAITYKMRTTCLPTRQRSRVVRFSIRMPPQRTGPEKDVRHFRICHGSKNSARVHPSSQSHSTAPNLQVCFRGDGEEAQGEGGSQMWKACFTHRRAAGRRKASLCRSTSFHSSR